MRSRFLSLICFLLAGYLLPGNQDPDHIFWTAQFSPDGKYIAVGANNEILIFNSTNYDLHKKYSNLPHVERVRWHPTENLLAVADAGPENRVIDVETDQIMLLKGKSPTRSRAAAWNHDGSLVAVADYEGVISIWDKKGKLIRTIRKESTKGYVALDWHPERNELIALSDHILVYDIEGSLLKNTRHRDESVLMLCVEWHPSGKFLAIGDYGDNQVPYPPLLQFWNTDLEKARTIRHSRAEFRNLDWSPDGEKLATASDALRIWSKNGKILAAGPSSEDYLWGVGWSPDGKQIVTSSTFGRIRIWDENARLVRELSW